mmetsp:Transcript_66275/g.209528  ORF Transcript_66275/g.209528 Transcript_66275/m.209528 type:complete len:285 (-) Transcript_66275:2145-2999(-)
MVPWSPWSPTTDAAYVAASGSEGVAARLQVKASPRPVGSIVRLPSRLTVSTSPASPGHVVPTVAGPAMITRGGRGTSGAMTSTPDPLAKGLPVSASTSAELAMSCSGEPGVTVAPAPRRTLIPDPRTWHTALRPPRIAAEASSNMSAQGKIPSAAGSERATRIAVPSALNCAPLTWATGSRQNPAHFSHVVMPVVASHEHLRHALEAEHRRPPEQSASASHLASPSALASAASAAAHLGVHLPRHAVHRSLPLAGLHSQTRTHSSVAALAEHFSPSEQSEFFRQ